MKAAVVAISTGVLAISLALPALLFAQDDPPATPAAEATTPPEAPAPAASVAEPPPAGDGEGAVTAGATETAATTAVAKGSASVQMRDFAFSPASVTIDVGDSVSWTNVGATDHDAVSSAFSTATVSPGSSASETFSTAGTFSYVCSFHPQMKGTVQVVGTGGAGGTTSDTDSTTLPGSEAAAAAAADAAGSASALPATGQSEPPLLVVGLGLVGCGAIAALLARWREREDLV
ncbi:MAG: plastocyanin/azurin family copper-binding protein [bacterium]